MHNTTNENRFTEDLLRVLARDIWETPSRRFSGSRRTMKTCSGYSGGTAPASNRLALDEDALVIAVLRS